MFLEQREWDMMPTVAEIKEQVLKNVDKAFKTNKKEIFRAWRTVFFLLRTVLKSGVLGMEEAIVNLRTEKIPIYHYLESIVWMLTDATEINLILEVMTNDFFSRNNPKPGEAFILYLYMTLVLQMYREDTGVFPSAKNIDDMTLEQILEMNLEIIPPEYQDEFRKHIPKYWLV